MLAAAPDRARIAQPDVAMRDGQDLQRLGRQRVGADRLGVGQAATQGADELPITADSLVRPLCVRAAASGRLAPVAGPHWITVGDAALTLDPLSSRGLAAAMAGGIHAATALAARRAGGTTDPAGYARALADIHHRHLADRRAYYGLEGRWPDAAFWRRRAAAPALGVSP